MYIDLIVIIVILLSAGLAFFRGFIREALTILGVVGGLLAAYQFGDDVTPLFNSWLGVSNDPNSLEAQRQFAGVIGYDQLAKVLAYACVFILVVVILSIVSYFLSRGAEKIGLGMIDRTFGVIFGIARGILILGLIYLPFQMFLAEEEKEEWFSGSRTIIYVEWTAEWIRNFFPDNFMEEDEVRTKTDETRQKLKALEILPEVMENEETDRNTQGYQEEQRESLDQLIEQEALEEEGRIEDAQPNR
jgi:membrane protein required for colicin V production